LKPTHEDPYDIVSAAPADALRSRAAANRQRAVAVVAAASVPLGIAIGLLFWWGVSWPAGVVAFVVGTLAVAAIMWWAAEPFARRALGGTPADPRRHARLLNLVDALCATVGIRHPDVRVRADQGLNAAVCGRSRRSATLVVTQGLLDELNRIELEGVVAQQLTRIRAQDMLPATVTVATLGIGATFLSPNEPVTAMDRAAVSFTRYPPGLISALEKMAAKTTEVRGASRATGQLWFADPGVGRAPVTPLKDRVEALREL
jgi:heat shock protein HtpX